MQCESIRVPRSVVSRSASALRPEAGAARLLARAPRGLHRQAASAPGLRQLEEVAVVRVTLDEVDDGALVQRCRGGDALAFEALFRRHSGQVSRLVYRMGGSSADLEDLVQEVFLQVIRSLSGFRDEARFSTWLYRVTINVVLMQRRAAGRRPKLVDEEQAAPATDDAPSAEDTLETRLRVQAFHRLLERLSDKKRAVFVLHELEGLSPARISEIVEAPVLTVRTRLFYARRDLLRWLADEPDLAALAEESSAGGGLAPGSARRYE